MVLQPALRSELATPSTEAGSTPEAPTPWRDEPRPVTIEATAGAVQGAVVDASTNEVARCAKAASAGMRPPEGASKRSVSRQTRTTPGTPFEPACGSRPQPPGERRRRGQGGGRGETFIATVESHSVCRSRVGPRGLPPRATEARRAPYVRAWRADGPAAHSKDTGERTGPSDSKPSGMQVTW